MRLILRATMSLIAGLPMAGCLTHIAPDPHSRHLSLPWVEDFETARGIAIEGRRPILLVMVAGDLGERC